MKNVLTLKHSVFIAAAVLLFAGFAFVGAGAAATYVDWSADNITSAGGDFIINDLGGTITPLYLGIDDYLTLENDLTIDFNYQTVSVTIAQTGSGVGGVLGVVIMDGHKLTIKNLTIADSDVRALDGEPTNQAKHVGAVIGGLPSYITTNKGKGVLTLENVIVRNTTVRGSGTGYVGGISGGMAEQYTVITNCSVLDSTVMSDWNSVGGICGGSYAGATVTDSLIANTYVVARNNGAGAVTGSVSDYDQLDVQNVSVINCVVKAQYNAGGIASIEGVNAAMGSASVQFSRNLANAFSLAGKARIMNTTVSNTAVIATEGIAGGLIAGPITPPATYKTSDALTLTDNTVEFCTISGKTVAGGFCTALVTSKANYQTIASNTVKNTCVIATGGDAAGFCPTEV